MKIMGTAQRPKRARKIPLGSIERELLEDLSLGDLLVGFLLSARSTRLMYKTARERARRRYRTQLALSRLVREGYIDKTGDKLSLSDSGRKALSRTIYATRDTLKKKKWDGKWRMVAYDIPTRLGPLRNHVRSILVRAGFQKLQQSIWIFPHECKELTDLIKSDERVKDYVLYGVIEHIENEKSMRAAFKL